MDWFTFLACLAATLILVALIDPDFSLKVGVCYLIVSFGTLLMLKYIPTNNEFPHKLGMSLFGLGLLLLLWWAAWRLPSLADKLTGYRKWQQEIWQQILTRI